jgi:short-subunit dehydrogenase
MNRPIFFVTGASGFVGRTVCKLLINSGYEVRAMVRNNDTELSQLGVKLWIGDLWHQERLEEAIIDTDVVIHCAGNARFGNGLHYQRENVELTDYLIQIIKKKIGNISRFVYISTIGAIDRERTDSCALPLTENSRAFPCSDYGKSKLQAEQIVNNSGLPFTIIRPTLVVGKEMRFDSHFAVFARQALTGALISKVAWSGCFSVIHVDDLATAIVIASNHPDAINHIYFCAGETVAIADFFNQCRAKKKTTPLLFMPLVAKSFIRWLPFQLKAMLFPALVASDEKLRELGWQPQYSAQSALEEIINREKTRLNPELSPGGQTVITGAASGLGRALAIYLSPKRERILLVDKDRAGLENLATRFKNCTISVVDLADEEEVEKLLISSNWQDFNITELYACAGIGLRGRMQDISITDHRKMFAINVLARIALTKAVIDVMQKQQFGRIVLISSSSAFQPLPYMATYAATNSAVLSIGESWGEELTNDNIQIMTVCPGGMQTNFQKSGGVKELKNEKLMMPEAVVIEIMKGLRQGKKTLIVSFRSFAMSMLARVLPRNLLVKLWNRLMEKMR